MPIIHTATEDELSESVACKIVQNYFADAEIGLKLRKGGNGYLKSSLHKFRQMANREHVFLLTDLDSSACAPTLIGAWFGNHDIPPQLFFRVAVREIEAWLLADRAGMANLFEINEANFPPNPDNLHDPKQALLQLARRAPRAIRSELLRVRGTVSSQGLGYNRILTGFVESGWEPDRARINSPSLDKALNRLSEPTI